MTAKVSALGLTNRSGLRHFSIRDTTSSREGRRSGWRRRRLRTRSRLRRRPAWNWKAGWRPAAGPEAADHRRAGGPARYLGHRAGGSRPDRIRSATGRPDASQSQVATRQPLRPLLGAHQRECRPRHPRGDDARNARRREERSPRPGVRPSSTAVDVPQLTDSDRRLVNPAGPGERRSLEGSAQPVR